jgi:ABC-type uncharacterized transport system ATPase subunit
MLTVTGLTKRFGGFIAVNDVSFTVEQGELVGLIGPNGSGKSTIFNMLAGALVPNRGSITFEGRELAGQPPHRIINLGIGRTFQIPRPFHRLSLLENVVLSGFYGQGRPSRAKAFEAAERALAAKGKAPLIFLSYDYGRLLKMGGDVMAQMGGSMPGMNERMAQLFGLAAVWAHVSDQGLAVSLTMEMQP